MDLLKIDQVIFLSKTNAVNNIINQIATESFTLPEVTSSAVALENYRTRFNALADMLHLYKCLLLQDIYTINDKGNSLAQADIQLGNSILSNSILSK